MKSGRFLRRWVSAACVLVAAAIIAAPFCYGADLPEVKARGVLRHIGVPYANFVTGSGDGMDVELVRLFAKHIGVKYEYVRSNWADVIGDLTGKKVKAKKGGDVEIIGETPVKGDLIANGMTVIPWRQKVVDFSTPYFPTQVWLIARSDSTIRPIKPSGDIQKDISQVKALLKGHSVLGKANTCLDPSLYSIKETGAQIKLFNGGLNELAPAIINGEAELTLLDVPDALIALEKWHGSVKVIGPISPPQVMACAFAKTSPQLRAAFNEFLEQCKKDGTYKRIVKKYYPAVFTYFGEFFEN